MVETCPQGASHHFNPPPNPITFKLNKLMCRVAQGFLITVLELSIRHMVAACQHISHKGCKQESELKSEKEQANGVESGGSLSREQGLVHRLVD